MPRGASLRGRVGLRRMHGGAIQAPQEKLDVVNEDAGKTEYTNGQVVQKPLQSMFGTKTIGLNIRSNSNVIQPFSNPIRPKRIPLSAETINVQNDVSVAHLGKAIGSAQSPFRRISLTGGALPSKNNIKLVL